MKKSFLLISVVTLLIYTVVLTGCSHKRAQVDGTGTIEAQEVDIAATHSGILLELSVEEGDTVGPDQTIARIDDEVPRLQLQQAEAQRDQAQAQLSLLEEGPHPRDIESAEARLQQAAHQLDLARKEWERIKTLYNEDSVTKKQYDSGMAAFRTRQAQYAGAKASVEKLKELPRSQEIASAEAALRRAQQQVEIARSQVDDCTLRSPIRGIISELYYEKGELVPAGRSLATVRNNEQVYVTVYVPEPLLAHIKTGQTAEVYIDGMPDTVFSGKISHINQEAEFTPKNVQTKEQRVKLVYAIKIDVKNKNGILKPGMPADVNLHIAPEGE